VTRAEERAEKVRATLTAPIEWEPAHTADAEAALSELVADANSWKHAAEQLSKLHNSVVYERDKLRADAEALAEEERNLRERLGRALDALADAIREKGILAAKAEALAEALKDCKLVVDGHAPWAVQDKITYIVNSALARYRGEK
jgi:chromosome segregation ATPase